MSKMKKAVLTIAIASTLGFSHIAAAGNQTVTLGYAQSKVQDFKNINGVNVKYRYEWDQPIGIITSFSYMSGKETESYFKTRDIMSGKVEVKYYSLAVGPTYRMNDFISVYGLLGGAVGKVDSSLHWLNYTSSGYEDMGTYHEAETKSSVVYGVGLQINPMQNLAIDLAYEGSRLKYDGDNYSVNGFNVGVGYRF
jgi:putative virulence related protein PagC